MGVTLGCRHPGVAKNLLHYADMHALLDQQRGGSMPRVVDPGIPDLRLAENSLPGSPVLGAFDWSAVAGSEYQIKGLSMNRPLSAARRFASYGAPAAAPRARAGIGW
jgi:hypothetical protein